MRSTLIAVALTAVVIQTASAIPRPFFFADSHAEQAVGGNKNIISVIFDGFGDFAKEINDGFGDATKQAQNFAESIGNATLNFIKEAEEYQKAIDESVTNVLHQNLLNFVSLVKAFRRSLTLQIARTRNRIKQHIFTDIERQLSEIDQSASELQQQVRELRLRWKAEIASQDQRILNQWNVWATEQLLYVDVSTNGNESIVDQVERIISEFINRYGNFLNSCADEVEVELQQFEKQVETTIERHQTDIQVLIAQVMECIQSGDSNGSSRICDRNARMELRKLSGASRDLARLGEDGLELLYARYGRRSCVIQTLMEFELERRSIQRRVFELVKKANTDTENGSDSSESPASQSESLEGAAFDESESSKESEEEKSTNTSELEKGSQASSQASECGIEESIKPQKSQKGSEAEYDEENRVALESEENSGEIVTESVESVDSKSVSKSNEPSSYLQSDSSESIDEGNFGAGFPNDGN